MIILKIVLSIMLIFSFVFLLAFIQDQKSFNPINGVNCVHFGTNKYLMGLRSLCIGLISLVLVT
jgi:hypothetical protein